MQHCALFPLRSSSTLRARPQVYEDLLANVDKLERHYKDMQDIEFTIQEGRLFMLQVFRAPPGPGAR